MLCPRCGEGLLIYKTERLVRCQTCLYVGSLPKDKSLWGSQPPEAKKRSRSRRSRMKSGVK